MVSSQRATLNQASITASEGFESRLQRSELRGATIMAFCWATAIGTAILRRALGGEIMGTNAVFFPTMILFVAALAYEIFVIVELRRTLRQGKRLSASRRLVTVVIELAVPAVALGILELYSPRGPTASLSAPVLLAFPIVIMLSVLRLRPKLTLAMGFGAALLHAGLTSYAIRAGQVDHHLWAMLFTYAVMLMLTGVTASMVAAQGRANVIEAVREAMTAEQEQVARSAIERDLDIARDIQSGLMPSVAPDIAGFDIAGMARPAQQTGGDYYDWQPTADGRLIVALADVTGHGIGPALVMAVCRAYARASAARARDAADLLSEVNALIVGDIGSSGRFITMVIAILSPDGSVELASAGHGPSLLRHCATGETDVFGGDGLPLGIDAAEAFDAPRRFTMAPGDTLVLATDGFMEWARAGDGVQFGLERLRHTVTTLPDMPAAECVRHIDRAAQAFAKGNPQQDDTTMVVIRRL